VDSLIERVLDYDMWLTVEEQLGLRKRLAAGFVYPYAPQHDPGTRRVESARVKDPVTGEWSDL